MPDQAVSVEIIKNNYQAIVSEAGSAFNDADKIGVGAMGFLKDWVEKNGSGYFIRDVTSPMDCLLLVPEDFHRLYRLLPPKTDEDGAVLDPVFIPIARR